MKFTLLFTLLVSSILMPAVTQNVNGFLKTNGTKIVDANSNEFIIHGIGPGGWMLQEGYMFGTQVGTQYEIRAMLEDLTDKATTDAFYDSWLANFFTRKDVELISQWGFNSIRVPLHYNLFTLPIEDEPVKGKNTWLDKGFTMVDDLVSWCEDNDIYLILDLHAAPGGQGKNADISDYDPSKPSLWESEANKDKTVALWRKLAERYKDKVYVGGYDLLNETNWGFAGDTGNENGCGCQDNTPLLNLYTRIIDTIRVVDSNHLLFIEGNCWANNFNGLHSLATYDSNIAFSFHKYWNYNTDDAINDLLQMRQDLNIPLFLGETGENSNTWMTDMVKQMERLGIGWSTWAYKQMDIDDPFTIFSDKWSYISNYNPHTGENRPTEANARAGMNEMLNNILTDNCQFNPGLIHALFSSPFGVGKKAFKEHNLPGVIFATDYDIGRLSDAWYDTDYQDLHVSTGEYTAWNQGYLYRNDGVDIEKCSDNPTNSYNVAWTKDGEWLRYSLANVTPGYYNITFRVAAYSGKINMRVDNQLISQQHISTPTTGGFQNWKDVIVENVLIGEDVSEVTLYIVNGGLNVNYMKFDLVSNTAINDLDKEKPAVGIKNVNSVGGQLKIEIENSGLIPVKMECLNLVNMQGVVVEQAKLPSLLNGSHIVVLNRPKEAGLYIIRLLYKDGLITKKVMI